MVYPAMSNRWSCFTVDRELCGYIPRGTILLVTKYNPNKHASLEVLYNNEAVWISHEPLVYVNDDE